MSDERTAAYLLRLHAHLIRLESQVQALLEEIPLDRIEEVVRRSRELMTERTMQLEADNPRLAGVILQMSDPDPSADGDSLQ